MLPNHTDTVPSHTRAQYNALHGYLYHKHCAWFWGMIFLAIGLGVYPTVYALLQAHVIDDDHRHLGTAILFIGLAYLLQNLCARVLEWHLGHIQPKVSMGIWHYGVQNWLSSQSASHARLREHLGVLADCYSHWWPWAHITRCVVMLCCAWVTLYHCQPHLLWLMLATVMVMTGLSMQHQRANAILSQRHHRTVTKWLHTMTIYGQYFDILHRWRLLTWHHHQQHHDGQQSVRAAQRLHTWQSKHRLLRNVCAALCVACAFLLTWQAYQHGQLTLGHMVMCMSLTLQMLELNWWLQEQWLVWQTQWAKATHALTMLTQPVPKPPLPQCLYSTTAQPTYLALHNISFGCKNHMILRNYSTEIQAGRPLLVQGPSGAGKSTFCQVLMGTKPYTGQITLHKNHAHCQADRPDWMMISAHDRIPELPIAAYFEHIDPNHIDTLCRDIALTLPQGWQSMSTAQLSAGQWQRLALMRALYWRPTVLILDEIFCHLEQHLALRLLPYVIAKRASCITIVVSHHLPWHQVLPQASLLHIQPSQIDNDLAHHHDVPTYKNI